LNNRIVSLAMAPAPNLWPLVLSCSPSASPPGTVGNPRLVCGWPPPPHGQGAASAPPTARTRPPTGVGRWPLPRNLKSSHQLGPRHVPFGHAKGARPDGQTEHPHPPRARPGSCPPQGATELASHPSPKLLGPPLEQLQAPAPKLWPLVLSCSPSASPPGTVGGSHGWPSLPSLSSPGPAAPQPERETFQPELEHSLAPLGFIAPDPRLCLRFGPLRLAINPS
jgi:hypothetical protein